MPPDIKRYDGLLLAAETTAAKTVPALLMSEGPVMDRDEEYTAEQLEAIATATNTYLASGEDTPLFYSNHNESGRYRTGDIAGGLQSGLEVREITEDNLPHPGMTDLVGKAGLFGSVALTMENGLKAYSGGVKKISVGLGGDNVIYEVSMVPWGAIRGASLYSKTFTPSVTSAGNLLIKGLSDEDKDAIAQYGLTLAQTQAEQAKAREADAVYGDFDAFLMTIADINREGREASFLEQAIADFSSTLRSRILPPTTTFPSLFSKEQPMPQELNPDIQPDQTTDQADLSTYQKQLNTLSQSNEDLAKNNAALTAKIEQMERRGQVATQYTRLRNQGESLIRQYKLTPAQFKATFSDDADADIDAFCNPEGEESKSPLEAIAYHYGQLEQYGQAVPPTARQDGTPQEISDPAQDRYDAELETYRHSRGQSTTPTTQEAQ